MEKECFVFEIKNSQRILDNIINEIEMKHKNILQKMIILLYLYYIMLAARK